MLFPLGRIPGTLPRRKPLGKPRIKDHRILEPLGGMDRLHVDAVFQGNPLYIAPGDRQARIRQGRLVVQALAVIPD